MRGDSPGFGGRELYQGLNRSARAFSGPRFDDLAHQHEKGDDAGGLVIAGRKRSQHRNRHQFIDAHHAVAKVTDRGQYDGIAENDRADQSAGAGDGMALLEEPIHDESIDDKNDADHRLPQADGGVLVPARAARIVVRVLISVLVTA